MTDTISNATLLANSEVNTYHGVMWITAPWYRPANLHQPDFLGRKYSAMDGWAMAWGVPEAALMDTTSPQP